MSYELYLYRSKTGHLDLAEAEAIVEGEEFPTPEELAKMESVAAALLAFDPRLERYVFDAEQLAKDSSLTADDFREMDDFIELNTREDVHPYLQITILRDYVALSFGWGMSAEFLDNLVEYVKLIHDETGYFFWDPQTAEVKHPLRVTALSGINPDTDMYNQTTGDRTERPWWKFW